MKGGRGESEKSGEGPCALSLGEHIERGDNSGQTIDGVSDKF